MVDSDLWFLHVREAEICQTSGLISSFLANGGTQGGDGVPNAFIALRAVPVQNARNHDLLPNI
jgi:hypothetical protein